VPHLFSIISGRTKKRTVFDGLTDMLWVSDIRGALTVPVLAEYLELWDLLTEVVLQPNVADTHIWRFAASGQYSAKSAYEAMSLWPSISSLGSGSGKAGHLASANFSYGWLRITKCWTADRLARKGLQHPESCLLCD
jgi:hypothetical protein